MKLFKKAAALFFCLTLALSVMAVTALADDDEAQLLEVVKINLNPEFAVTLTKKADDPATDRDSATTANVGYEITSQDDVTFDINLSYTHNSSDPYPDFSGKKIVGFQFDFIPGSSAASSTDANRGATFNGAKIIIGNYSSSMSHTATSVGASYTNTYAYTAGTSDDTKIDLSTIASASTPVKIGEITVSFDNASQNVAIYPQIENILIQMEGLQDMRRPAVKPEGSSPSTGGGEISFVPVISGTPIYEVVDSNGNVVSDGDTSGLVAAPGKAQTPVWVNPVYQVTVKHFKTDDNGFAVVKTSVDGDSYQTVNATAYDFQNGGSVTNEDNIPGYTFQGWMVTENTDTSTTWGDYAWSGTDPWNETSSYPATSTQQTSTPKNNETYWTDNAWFKAETGGKVVFVLNDSTKNAAGNVINTAPGVNFIAVGNTGTTTAIPAGMVGDIVLTPVYTRNVYTATFDAGALKATFTGAFTNDNVTAATATANAFRTKQYTIEDLYSTSVVDYLDLEDGNTALAVGAQGLTRTGYKFVGWTVTSTDAAEGYKWVAPTDNKTRVNKVSVITGATAKHYEAVTFKAEWELDIAFAKINYQYAGGGNYSLILVGVPNDETNSTNNYQAKYTYKCNNYDMFIIPDDSETEGGAQRTKYAQAAIDNTGDATDTFTSVYLKGSEGNGAYVLYAYIAAADTAESAITLVETDPSTVSNTYGNEVIVYDGDIDGSGIVNVGDFGNVLTLLNTPAATGIFALTDQSNVKVRLKADMDAADANTTAFGSIRDVVTIYNVMGYSA